MKLTLWRGRDVLDAEFEDADADAVQVKPFLDEEADTIHRHIERLTIAKMERLARIEVIQDEERRLGIEVVEFCAAIEAQQAALQVLARRHVTLVAAE